MDKSIMISVKVPMGDGQFFEYDPQTNDIGLVSLTDLWKRFGSIENKEPYNWKRTPVAKKFIKTFCESSNLSRNQVWKTTSGHGGGTWAHYQVAMTYMQYLSPLAQMAVNEIVKERIEEEADPELGIRRAEARVERKMKSLGRDETTVIKRKKTINKRNSLTSTLSERGVKGGSDWRSNGFIQVTNAQYVGWKGTNATGLRKQLGIDWKENPRDHFSDFDLDTIAFIDDLTEHKIKTENAYGADQCSIIGHDVGKNVAVMVDTVMRSQLTAS